MNEIIQNFDLNLIKIFMEVYECNSISNASKKLFISQPAVTSSIKRLEKFLNGKLFIRTPRGVKVTAEGEAFYEFCTNSLNTLLQGINNFSSFANMEKGSINIGCSSTIVRYLLAPFIVNFGKKYPNINISITDGVSNQLTSMLHKNKIDLAIMNMPIENESQFDCTKITTTQDCFIAPANFPKDFLSKEKLQKFPLVVQKKSNNRTAFDKMCMDNNINLNVQYETTSFGLITDFVEIELGLGYTIKNFIKKDISAGRVKVLETDLKITPRDVVALTKKGNVTSFACQTFIKELAENFTES
ncbi:MAG: LysR family transcriptional regulator [Clostridia bacterium]|nr:LysR family transcriptional regulator [Clostridia bacterium]